MNSMMLPLPPVEPLMMMLPPPPVLVNVSVVLLISPSVVFSLPVLLLPSVLLAVCVSTPIVVVLLSALVMIDSSARHSPFSLLPSLSNSPPCAEWVIVAAPLCDSRILLLACIVMLTTAQ